MLALLACLLGASAARPQNAPAPALVIRDVTVISPERAAPLEHAYVRIRNGRIDEVSAKPLDETFLSLRAMVRKALQLDEVA